MLVKDRPEVSGEPEYAMSRGERNSRGQEVGVDRDNGPIKKPDECIQTVPVRMLE
jgi:hypothetical protein